jgi:hypothetical protein
VSFEFLDGFIEVGGDTEGFGSFGDGGFDGFGFGGHGVADFLDAFGRLMPGQIAAP